MKNHLLLIIFLLISVSGLAQIKTIESDLLDLKLNVGDTFTPSSYVMTSDGSTSQCDNMIYYNKKGVFSTAQSIQVDNETGKIEANQPGLHEVVAVCITEGGKRLSRTFIVDVEFPAVKEIKITLNSDNVYEGTYVPISYEVIDEMGFVRENVNFSITSSNQNLKIDDVNNIKAVKPGSVTLNATYEGITGSLNLNVLKNPVDYINLTSSADQARTGDVIQLKAVAYNKKGQILNNIPFEYSFKGKSFDKSNSASGLVINDGRFVADVSGNYLVSASIGNISVSKALNIYERNVKRDVVKVGTGLVNDKHTSDF